MSLARSAGSALIRLKLFMNSPSPDRVAFTTSRCPPSASRMNIVEFQSSLEIGLGFCCGMFPTGSMRWRFLNLSAYSSVAYSTAPELRQGPR